jgi:hypothetical protein
MRDEPYQVHTVFRRVASCFRVMTQAEDFPETLVPIYQSKRRHIIMLNTVKIPKSHI